MRCVHRACRTREREWPSCTHASVRDSRESRRNISLRAFRPMKMSRRPDRYRDRATYLARAATAVESYLPSRIVRKLVYSSGKLPLDCVTVSETLHASKSLNLTSTDAAGLAKGIDHSAIDSLSSDRSVNLNPVPRYRT